MTQTVENTRQEQTLSESHTVTIDRATGKLTLDEAVVATIAGLVAREVDGIHSLGPSRLISFPFGDRPTRGVEAEVGQVEAAFDLDVVIDYGIDIRKVADALRRRIGEEVNKMAGRKVVEVNINVVGLHLPEQSGSKPENDTPRVH